MVIGGQADKHCGFGMRRGSILFSNYKPKITSSFVPSDYNFDSFFGLLLSDLVKLDSSFQNLKKRNFCRVVGDIAFSGKGEWFYHEG